MKNKKIKILFFGNSIISIHAINSIIKNKNLEIVKVITNEAKKSGRNHSILKETPVHEFSKKNNLDVIKSNSISNEIELIKKLKIDLIVTCSFGHILSKEILDIPKKTSLNIHTSLLPKGRGGAPIHWSIIKGEKETGVSFMKMEEKMDSGGFWSQKKVEIKKEDDYDSLYLKLSLIIEKETGIIIEKIFNNELDLIEQDEEKVEFWMNIKKEDSFVSFKNKSEDIFNKIRGLYSKPKAWCETNEKLKFKLIKSFLPKEELNLEKFLIGEIFLINKIGMFVKTLDNYIIITKLQFNGKKEVEIEKLLNGNFALREGIILK